MIAKEAENVQKNSVTLTEWTKRISVHNGPDCTVYTEDRS